MAKTYFEYADRLPGSQVDWFKVGKDITESIKKEDDLREKRKAATEEQFRKDTQELANAPQGNSDLVNKWTLDYAGDASDYLLQINKLLKSGAMKPKDYNIINQNLRGNTSTLFNLSKEYQAEYNDKMERAQPGGDGSWSEAQIMGMIEGFANLKDTKAIINPLDGSVSVGKLITNKDGIKVLAEGGDNHMSVNELRNRIKQKINKYKVDESLVGDVKMLGDVVNEVQTKTGTILSGGMITRITDPTQKKGLSQEGNQAVDAYLKSENDIIQSKLTNPYNTSSILGDWIGVDKKTGQPYQVVFDEKLAKTSSHYVLYSNKNGVMRPDFESTEYGKEQKKVAEDFLRTKFRSMLEQKTELRPTPQAQLQERRAKSESEIAAERDKAEAENFGRMLAYAVSGNAAQKRQAGDYFKATKGISGLEFTNQGINVLQGKTSLPYEFTTGGVESNSETLGRSMVKALNLSGLPEDVIIQAMKSNLLSPSISKVAIGKVGREAVDYAAEVGQYARKNVAEGVRFNDPQTTKTNLENKFKKLGFTFVGGSRGGTLGFGKDDYIAITAPNGKTQEFIIDDASNNTAIANFINDNRDDNVVEKSGLFGKKTPGTVTPQGGAPR